MGNLLEGQVMACLNGKSGTSWEKWKVSVFIVFLVRIFPHLDWIRTRKIPNKHTFQAVWHEYNIFLKRCQNCLFLHYEKRIWKNGFVLTQDKNFFFWEIIKLVCREQWALLDGVFQVELKKKQLSTRLSTLLVKLKYCFPFNATSMIWPSQNSYHSILAGKWHYLRE